MAWREGTDQFVPDPIGFEPRFKQGQIILPFCISEAFRELRAIIGLHTFNGQGKCLDQMVQKGSRGIGTVLLKSLYEAPAGIFVDSGILIEFLPDGMIYQTDGRNKFHINLDPLPRITHLFIRFGDILGIFGLHGHHILFAQKAVKAWDRAFIAFLHEFDPKDNESGIRVSAPHIANELDLSRRMLVRMMMGTPGTITEGIPGAVITAQPAINILAIGIIFDGSFGDTMLLGKAD